MSTNELHFIVPGALEQRTGGYVYDEHVVSGLRALGWIVRVHSLEGHFPEPDSRAAESLGKALESIPDGARVVIDGLAMGGLPDPVRDQAGRLRIVSLVHHPLSEETGLDEETRRRFKESERAALEPCRGVVVTSTFTKSVLADFGVPEAKIAVVRPGTDPAPTADGPPAGQPPVVLCVATVTPRKGHEVLVAALERLVDVPWTCVCVGGLDRAVEYAQGVREQVARADLEDRIAFVGERAGKALEDLYRGASVFVLASWYEGYGMALSEAIARGLPVVSTTGGAIPHTVPSDAALLVPPGDAEALAEALRSVLTDDAARERLASAARQRASQLPDWDTSTRAFAEAVLALTE
jgi:glycosyltransferase involved in cell wall biosynthesis